MNSRCSVSFVTGKAPSALDKPLGEGRPGLYSSAFN